MKDDAPTDRDATGFISRWSRRKQQADLAEGAETLSLAIEAESAELELELEPEPELTDADMPSVESLDEGSDYSGFLSPGVSEELRQLALRKLFRAASFNVTDGLDDYDDDFTSFAKLGDIVTREMRVRNAIDAAREKAKEVLAALEAEQEMEQVPAPLGDPNEAAVCDEHGQDLAAERIAGAQDLPSTATLEASNKTLEEALQEIPHEQQS